MSEKRLTPEQLFLQHQRVMVTALAGNREVIDHPTAKGDATELHWLGMLGEHLPRRYQVERTFVLDHRSNVSEQIDVVIFDHQYSPILRADSGFVYLPAESVYAVFEVKQDLTRASLGAAAKKAASVRRLERTSAPIRHAGGVFEPKPLHPILSGLLTLSSSWSPPFGRPFERGVSGLFGDHALDLGCVLSTGAWRIHRAEGGGTETRTSAPETALITFFLDLLAALQDIATAPAIEFDRYARALTKHL